MIGHASTEFASRELVARIVYELIVSTNSEASTRGDQPNPKYFKVITQSGSTNYFALNFSSEDVGVATPVSEVAKTSSTMDFDGLTKRIRHLSSLPRGWLDGEGEPFPPSAESWLLQNLATLPFINRPGLSPTLEGNLSAEWSVRDWEATAQINLHDQTVWWHALKIKNTSEEQDEEFKLTSNKDWGHLCELVNSLFALNA
jgi:hypothetical protein